MDSNPPLGQCSFSPHLWGYAGSRSDVAAQSLLWANALSCSAAGDGSACVNAADGDLASVTLSEPRGADVRRDARVGAQVMTMRTTWKAAKGYECESESCVS